MLASGLDIRATNHWQDTCRKRIEMEAHQTLTFALARGDLCEHSALTAGSRKTEACKVHVDNCSDNFCTKSLHFIASVVACFLLKLRLHTSITTGRVSELNGAERPEQIVPFEAPFCEYGSEILQIVMFIDGYGQGCLIDPRWSAKLLWDFFVACPCGSCREHVW